MPLVADLESQNRTYVRPRTANEPLRRRQVRPIAVTESLIGRRTIHVLLIFITVVLVVDSLVGDKGLMETIRARRQHRDVAASLSDVRRRNAALREDIRQLREDPGAIEALARKELGLVRPGELLFIVRDGTSPSARPR
jgi:cell division protein FtsB